MQSLSVVHVERQALLVPHLNAPQSTVLVWLHVPVPVQNDGGWNVVPVHEIGLPQTVDALRCVQPPFPLHTPVLPHSPFGAQLPGSAVLFGTFEQVPAPFRLHAWQAEQLEVVQQTPSVQLPAPHSLGAPHVAPSAFLATQSPLPLQYRLVLEQ